MGTGEARLAGCLRQAVQVAAAGVGMDRLERVGHQLQLANPPGGIGQPGLPPVGGQQCLALVVFVGLEFVQLALEALLDEGFDELAKLLPRRRWEGRGHPCLLGRLSLTSARIRKLCSSVVFLEPQIRVVAPSLGVFSQSHLAVAHGALTQVEVLAAGHCD